MLRWKIGLLVLVAAAMGTLVILHVHGINGPWYWFWPWRRLPAFPLYGLMALAAVPFFAAQMLRQRWAAIGLLVLSCFALKIVSVYVLTETRSLDVVPAIVEDRFTTSYYTDAGALSSLPIAEWMPLYPQLMHELNLHSKTKPPGPILYWLAFIKSMGYGSKTALAGGLALGAIATLAIPATYLMLRSLLRDADAAFCGASFLALCPGFVLFFPMFDPLYILLSTAMIGFWYVALRDNRTVYAVLLGVTLAATCAITFNVLVVGLFMIGLIFVATNRWQVVLKQAAIALFTAAILLGLLWIIAGYDPIATFVAALRNQHELVVTYAKDRRWPITIPFDLTDFALGSGWISFLLVIYYFFEPARKPVALLAIVQIILVALLGFLPAETSRVWNFMLPLLMVPIGLELSRWPRWARITCYACLLFVTAAICQNMRFL